MAFRNVMIESPAKISVKNKQLLIFTDREYSLAVEDISALLLESRQSTITTAALSLLGQSGCALFVCDEKHIPCAVIAFNVNSSPFFENHVRKQEICSRFLQTKNRLNL